MGQSAGKRQRGTQTIHKQSNGEQVDTVGKAIRLAANTTGKAGYQIRQEAVKRHSPYNLTRILGQDILYFVALKTCLEQKSKCKAL